MRRLATFVSLASLLATAGCCFVDEIGACVVEAQPGTGSGYAHCDPVEGEPICLVEVEYEYEYGDESDLPPPSQEPCGGTFHSGRSCSDLGFTVECHGGYSVRPGWPC